MDLSFIFLVNFLVMAFSVKLQVVAVVFIKQNMVAVVTRLLFIDFLDLIYTVFSFALTIYVFGQWSSGQWE
jgi:hypothetical protein